MGDPSDLVPQPSPEHCAELFDAGETFESLRDWFGLSEEARQNAVDNAILAVSKNGSSMRDRMRHVVDLDPTHFWMLRNLAALTSPEVGKIFTLDKRDEELTEADIRKLQHKNTAMLVFLDSVERLEDQHDEEIEIRVAGDDFATAQDFFYYDMLVDQMGVLLRHLADTLPEGHDFFQPDYDKPDGTAGGRLYEHIVPLIRCIDLISDDELLAHLPNSEGVLRLDHFKFGEWMEQFLAMDIYPNSLTLERLITYNPASATADTVVRTQGGKVPLGAYYHALLRRVTHLEVAVAASSTIKSHWTHVGSKKLQEIVGHTADYLLNGMIMDRYLPYIETDQAWDDELITPKSGGLLYTNVEAIKQGEDAVAQKAHEFAETVRVVYANLLAADDIDTANLLLQKYKHILGPT